MRWLRRMMAFGYVAGGIYDHTSVLNLDEPPHSSPHSAYPGRERKFAIASSGIPLM